MNTPLAFISYDIAVDEAGRERLLTEAAEAGQVFQAQHWSEKARSPRDEWQKMLHDRIGRCDFMIVLVSHGMDGGQAAAEILEAKRCNVPFFGVHVGDGPPPAVLPDGLPANRTIAWDWQRIESAVRQVSKEGKHHVFA